MRPPLPPAQVRDTARQRADLTRGNWLLLVSEGLSTPIEVIQEAQSAAGAPLLKLGLRQLVMAQPDWGEARANAFVSKVIQVSGSTVATGKATIGWLLDRRSAGRRFAAWLDTIEVHSGPPCTGFPFRLEAGV